MCQGRNDCRLCECVEVCTAGERVIKEKRKWREGKKGEQGRRESREEERERESEQ